MNRFERYPYLYTKKIHQPFIEKESKPYDRELLLKMIQDTKKIINTKMMELDLKMDETGAN